MKSKTVKSEAAATARFLTIQDGDYTINLNLISEIDWTPGEEEATIAMVTGNEFTVEDDDFRSLKSALGL